MITALKSLENLFATSGVQETKKILFEQTTLESKDIEKLIKILSKPKKNLKKDNISKVFDSKKTKKLEREIKYSLCFDKDSMEDLNWICSLNPAFEMVIYATRLARLKLSFPIENVNGLTPLFKEKVHPKIKKQGLSMKIAKKYFNKSFFPLEDIKDFRSKLMAALLWGEQAHKHEDFINLYNQQFLNK